jgi:hypothetical protein
VVQLVVGGDCSVMCLGKSWVLVASMSQQGWLRTLQRPGVFMLNRYGMFEPMVQLRVGWDGVGGRVV